MSCNLFVPRIDFCAPLCWKGIFNYVNISWYWVHTSSNPAPFPFLSELLCCLTFDGHFFFLSRLFVRLIIQACQSAFSQRTQSRRFLQFHISKSTSIQHSNGINRFASFPFPMSFYVRGPASSRFIRLHLFEFYLASWNPVPVKLLSQSHFHQSPLSQRNLLAILLPSRTVATFQGVAKSRSSWTASELDFGKNDGPR